MSATIEHTYEMTKKEFETATNAAKEMANAPETIRSRALVAQMTFDLSLITVCLYLLQEVEELKAKWSLFG